MITSLPCAALAAKQELAWPQVPATAEDVPGLAVHFPLCRLPLVLAVADTGKERSPFVGGEGQHRGGVIVGVQVSPIVGAVGDLGTCRWRGAPVVASAENAAHSLLGGPHLRPLPEVHLDPVDEVSMLLYPCRDGGRLLDEEIPKSRVKSVAHG